VSRAHRPILGTLARDWPDEAACAADAAAWARRAPAELEDAIVCLDGPLGAGKTAFARHLLRALGVCGRIRSPTYTLMEPYEWVAAGGGRVAVSHFDFYRFDDPEEWSSAGFRDVFAAPGLKLVEWAVRAGDLMPAPDLELHLEPLDGDRRRVVASAYTRRGQILIDAWRGDGDFGGTGLEGVGPDNVGLEGGRP
jgi:tRNA threonylcarbamoyladenosine biosynthesis protein TsaE